MFQVLSHVKKMKFSKPIVRYVFSFDKIKVQNTQNIEDEKNIIQEYDNIDPYWKMMESRVINRKTKKKGEGKSGRSEVPPTDEEFWHRAGLYSNDVPKS
jgi:hypothetical protein